MDVFVSSKNDPLDAIPVLITGIFNDLQDLLIYSKFIRSVFLCGLSISDVNRTNMSQIVVHLIMKICHLFDEREVSKIVTAVGRIAAETEENSVV